jgi:broad specificity polyphosphatase/5'/3'-nucleotidase SurE
MPTVPTRPTDPNNTTKAIKGKPNNVPKMAVRSALITAAVVSTLIGAQTIAFSQKLTELQDAQADYNAVVVETATPEQISQQLITLISPVASLTPTDTATEVYIPPTLVPAQQNLATAIPSATPMPTATVQPTIQPTIQPTATQVTVQQNPVVPAPRQPRARTKSSK